VQGRYIHNNLYDGFSIVVLYPPAGLDSPLSAADQDQAEHSSMKGIGKLQGPCLKLRTVTKDALRALYDLPITDAARELGIGVTVLKKICRKHEIVRWPYRKRKSLSKLIECVKDYANREKSESAKCLPVIQELE
jgi:hypothetical protein